MPRRRSKPDPGSGAELDRTRRFYAEEIRAVCNLRSNELVEAFAAVPREKFLGPGPWWVKALDMDLNAAPYQTANADPRHVYHNVPVAIDRERNLYNGQPATLAAWLDAVQLKPGESVLHIGCASGYYTAIMAHAVGSSGRVTAVEIDAGLAQRARDNLASMPWVEVRTGDASGGLPAGQDAVVVNAGVTHPLPAWLDSLSPGGRMILPLTFAVESMPGNIGKGVMLLATRQEDGFSARLFSMVAIYSCAGARDPILNQRLPAALAKGNWFNVRRLRLDAHEPSADCWLHGDAFCLSG